jgi:hypothetical protein
MDYLILFLKIGRGLFLKVIGMLLKFQTCYKLQQNLSMTIFKMTQISINKKW